MNRRFCVGILLVWAVCANSQDPLNPPQSPGGDGGDINITHEQLGKMLRTLEVEQNPHKVMMEFFKAKAVDPIKAMKSALLACSKAVKAAAGDELKAWAANIGAIVQIDLTQHLKHLTGSGAECVLTCFDLYFMVVVLV